MAGIYMEVYAQSNGIPDSSGINKPLSPEQVQAYNDSIAAMRTYMKSKAYNDSLDMVRKARMDSIRAHQDSVKRENLRLKDSMQQAFEEKKRQQQLFVDSVKREKQKVVDSLNEIKKYRTSRHYKDSVAHEKQRQIDSMKYSRQVYMDSVKSERQRQLDSMKLTQQKRNDSLQASIQARNDSMRTYIDSLKAAQQSFKDSLEIVKQNRIDSLSKLKEERENEMYDRDKQRQKDLRDKEREKIQKERDNYTNDVFLKKKWGLRRKIVQNTFTRYNYYYNATNKIKEAERNMYMSKVDNFDSTLSLYPYDPGGGNVTMFSNDMDSLAKRLSVGIQIHDPRSKWQDDLYLLLGKSYYYKGDFENAALAFEYVMNYDKKYEIQKKKKKKKGDEKNTSASGVLNLDPDKSGLAGLLQHKLAKNEAVIWLSRSYIKQKEYDKAQILLDMISIDPNADNELKAMVYETYAHLYLEKNEMQSALPYLDSIAFNTHLDKRVRQRAGYIGGQLYADNSDWENAERLFSKVTDMHAPIEMDLNANLNEIVAKTYSSEDNYPQIIRQLNRMSREDKYKMYYDRIFMALAQTYNKNGDKKNAIESYNKTIQLAVNSPVTKGMAYYELGELYYNDKKYVQAQTSYDSAGFYLQSTDRKDVYDRAVTIAKNLQVISVPATQVQLIDSILSLTRMSDRERSDWAKSEVKKHEEGLRIQNLPGNVNTSNNRGGWYFQNTEQVQKGAAEFRQSWGNRPLVDNWRRSNDIRFTGNPEGAGTEDNTLSAGTKIDEKYFLSQIPHSQEVIDSLNNQLEKSYVDLEKTFYLTEEYSSVKDLYRQFVSKYPHSEYLDLFYHDLFFIYLRQPQQDSAQHFKEKLATEFPHSPLYKTVSELNMSQIQDNTFVDYKDIEEHLDETYRMLHARMFTDVIVRTEQVKKEYPVQIAKYQSQYNLMKATAYAGLEDYQTADTLLKEFIAVTQNDTLKTRAQDVLNYIQSLQGVADEDTTRSDVSNISFLDPTLMNSQYSVNKNEKHYVVIYVDKYDNRIMPLRAGIMDYNIMKKSDQDLKASFSELKNNERVIVVKEMKNDSLAKKYISDLKQQKDLFKEYKMDVDIKIVTMSESNFIILLNKKDFMEYLSFFNKNY